MEYQEDALVCQLLLQKGLVDIEELSLCHDLQREDKDEGKPARPLRELLLVIEALSPDELEAALKEGRSAESSRLRRRRADSSTSARRRPSGRLDQAERKVIGPFEIIEKLARGGMGSIYKARDRISGDTIALKVLHAERCQPSDTERFLREARIACSLQYDGLVRGLSFGNDAGLPFFAMEYVRGESLKATLSRGGAMAPSVALDVLLRLTRTLDCIHGDGLIHRDIKPDNILIADNGEVKLCDLGLAREVDLMTTVTQSGQAIGTPRYISPEQARGEKGIDARADIYSLGITFFHMLTGRPPFPEESGVVVLSRHLYDQVPSIRSLDPSLPPCLDRIVKRMTRKRRTDRFGSTRELTGALCDAIRDLEAKSSLSRMARCA